MRLPWRRPAPPEPPERCTDCGQREAVVAAQFRGRHPRAGQDAGLCRICWEASAEQKQAVP